MSAPVTAIPPSELTPDDPLWLWAEQGIGERVEGMLEHIDRVREGSDIEGVHDMRVGSRRLVAAMRVFALAFPDGEFRSLSKEAKRVTRALGAVRDQDVLIDYFQGTLRSTLPASPEGWALRYLLDRLERERRQARRPMLRYLREVEDSRFQERLLRYLAAEAKVCSATPSPDEGGEAGEGGGSGPHTPLRVVAEQLLLIRIEEFFAFRSFADQPDAVEELHDMRIAAKWLRYTMELFAGAYSGGLKKPLAVVKRLQEHLGTLHDADVRLELLRSTGWDTLRAGSIQRIGLLRPDAVVQGIADLITKEEAVRANAYSDFHAEWRKQEEKRFQEKLLEAVASPAGRSLP